MNDHKKSFLSMKSFSTNKQQKLFAKSIYRSNLELFELF
jgi:hypothetical protein